MYKNSGTVHWTVCFYHLYTKGTIDIYDTETDTKLQSVYLMTELSLRMDQRKKVIFSTIKLFFSSAYFERRTCV